MTAFQVFHVCREHREGSSKFGGVEGASVNVWESMGGGTPQKKEQDKQGEKDSLEKGKCQANSYTGATVNVNYKLSNFFPMLYQK